MVILIDKYNVFLFGRIIVKNDPFEGYVPHPSSSSAPGNMCMESPKARSKPEVNANDAVSRPVGDFNCHHAPYPTRSR